jgi:hypothetical protein
MKQNKILIAKKVLFLMSMLWLSVAVDATAQNWNEWFKQKETQKRYLARQIALLKIYTEYLREGITIVNKGLNTVRNIQNGDFNLHRDFFGSLKNVNPHIANSAKVADIIAFHVFVVRELHRVNNFCRNNRHFTAEEIRYVSEVYTNMVYLCDVSLSELLTIIQPNYLEMKDDERHRRIDIIHQDALDRQTFASTFSSQTKLLATQREREQRDITTMKQLLTNDL